MRSPEIKGIDKFIWWPDPDCCLLCPFVLYSETRGLMVRRSIDRVVDEGLLWVKLRKLFEIVSISGNLCADDNGESLFGNGTKSGFLI